MKTLFLEAQDDCRDPRTIAVGSHLHLGRGPHNGVVLGTPDVSWSHAVLRVEDGQLVAEDLGSRNGTWVDGVRIERPTSVRQHVRIGNYTLTPRDDTHPEPPVSPLFLEEVSSSIRYPLDEGSFLLGDAPGANIHVPGARPEVLRVSNGEVRIGEESLRLPWRGSLGGSDIRIFQEARSWSPTLPDTTRFASRKIRVSLEPPSAQVADLKALKHHTITAPNRVSLLYFLARARQEDLTSGSTDEQAGWRSDEDVAVAVWGRTGRGGPRNRLNTLTYRLRTELTEGGLREGLLEKKAGWVRMAECDIELV